jgi:large subunit ribosomal protein L25
VDPKALMGILRSESGVNTLIGLTVGDEDVKVLMREYQVDPVSRKLLHADFYRIRSSASRRTFRSISRST